MKIQKVNICFTPYTDSDLLTKAEGILLSLTGNASFPTLTPSLATVQTAITDYSNALTAATDRGRNHVAVKNQCRLALELLLMQLGLTVMSIANGDVTMLTTSGYTLSKLPTPVHISNPGSVTLSSGVSSGQLQASVPAVPGAKGYLHQITPDPIAGESAWQSTPSSKSRYVFTGLEAGKKYWVRVVAIRSGEQVAYGPASAMFVQ